MLATLTVNLNTDAAVPTNDGNLTLREAIAYVNGTSPAGSLDAQRIQGTLGQNDTVVFSGLNGGTITITGSTLIVSKPVTIQGPTNGVRIQKGASSTATAGLRFENFRSRSHRIANQHGHIQHAHFWFYNRN